MISAGVNAERDGPADYVCVLQRMWSAPVNDADVRLILAAPDLLEALRQAHDFIGGLPEEMFDTSAQHACADAYAAISKATGSGEKGSAGASGSGEEVSPPTAQHFDGKED